MSKMKKIALHSFISIYFYIAKLLVVHLIDPALSEFKDHLTDPALSDCKGFLHVQNDAD